MFAVGEATASKSSAWPVVETIRPELLTLTVLLTTSELMRKPSFETEIVAPALLLRVKLRTVLPPAVSMPRAVDELIVPELSMVTPGAGEGPDQVIAVPSVDSAAPAATEPASVPVTALGDRVGAGRDGEGQGQGGRRPG